jgi:hypothetical protein
VVNYLGNFNPTIFRVKKLWQITAENCHGILSLTLKADLFTNVVKQFNTTVIYCHSMVITKVMLLYNTE